MNYTAYIQRQKNLIRSRHEGETFLAQKGEVVTVSESERLLFELSDLRGLNKRDERPNLRRVAV